MFQRSGSEFPPREMTPADRVYFRPFHRESHPELLCYNANPVATADYDINIQVVFVLADIAMGWPRGRLPERSCRNFRREYNNIESSNLFQVSRSK